METIQRIFFIIILINIIPNGQSLSLIKKFEEKETTDLDLLSITESTIELNKESMKTTSEIPIEITTKTVETKTFTETTQNSSNLSLNTTEEEEKTTKPNNDNSNLAKQLIPPAEVNASIAQMHPKQSTHHRDGPIIIR